MRKPRFHDIDSGRCARQTHGRTQRLRFARPSQQIEIIDEIEHTPFFAIARSLVIIGAFGDPSYGGNRGGVGWKLLAIEHGTTYAAPFGWYDSGRPDAA